MGLWQAVNSMSNHAMRAWMKSWGFRTFKTKGAWKARSAEVTVYRSIVKTRAGSVTQALTSTVSTSGSVNAVSFKGV